MPSAVAPMNVGTRPATVSTTQVTSVSKSGPDTVAHSPVVPRAMIPCAPSPMRFSISREVSSVSTVSVALHSSTPARAGAGMIA